MMKKFALTHERQIWLATCLLFLFIGMGVANGLATREALNDQWGSCTWTLRNELQHQKYKLQKQQQKSPYN